MTMWQRKYLLQGVRESFIRLNPITLLRNPVMLVVETGSIITTAVTMYYIMNSQAYALSLQVCIWLWITVLFANFAEALAEIREGKGGIPEEHAEPARRPQGRR